MSSTLAALTIASAASTMPTKPLVSIIPRASAMKCVSPQLKVGWLSHPVSDDYLCRESEIGPAAGERVELRAERDLEPGEQVPVDVVFSRESELRADLEERGVRPVDGHGEIGVGRQSHFRRQLDSERAAHRKTGHEVGEAVPGVEPKPWVDVEPERNLLVPVDHQPERDVGGC